MPKHPLSPPIFPYPWAAEWGEDRYGLYQVLQYKDASYTFRWIPKGRFMMGSPENEQGSYGWEDYHQVSLSQGFWLGETPVTQDLYEAITGNNPSHFKGAALPVEQVSCDDAQAFIKIVNSLHPSLTVRLPWEAEWEYACRAGTSTAFHWGDEISLDLANYCGTWNGLEHWDEGAKQATTAVKSYPCNAWGLYDMHGNVWEWCEDVLELSLGTEAATDPFRSTASDPPASGALRRVLRGGSWGDRGRYVRSAYRSGRAPDNRHNSLGFRLALGH
jgi:formylglycine-generating enzyme required for sulfatase activity